MAESFDLFPKGQWVTRSEQEHREATELFRASFLSARSGNDDSIKQVVLLFLVTCAFWNSFWPRPVFSITIFHYPKEMARVSFQDRKLAPRGFSRFMRGLLGAQPRT